ncbi:methanogenic corrinoid protein MtbC1 [Rhodoblastus acidophilus]|uniref:corrinoid protein n=1 Tax=Rhodoblastus acidophilus TaxID=1074 RepID=UPI0022242D91|nr:corrinoid protein [Rhodoblastus acidophilus]MCW2285437.1 methanogenic corrinoid protein MtbC1 [Rhodoblastus acidophilus]MCW2334314.1 methanogenic corrinoid protein MtbC1 [Rhodoblastus acidophilus]
MSDKQTLLRQMSDGVVNMEDTQVVELSKTYLREGHPALDGILGGLVDGMNRAGALYEQEDYFVSELLLCSDAMYAGLGELQPHLPESERNAEKIKAVIGVVEGDTHDIGKNLVKIMMEAAGFEMHDLGRDVPVEAFVAKAKEVGASLICLSTLMTTTMANMGRVVALLERENLRENVRVIIGGAPVSTAFAKKIGADAYAETAVAAVGVAKRLTAARLERAHA